MDKSDPVTPTNPDAAAPTPPPGPTTLTGWLIANSMPLAFVAAIVVAIIYFDLDVLTMAQVVFGLGLVIFIHELGHFVAAKLCDVHVETFSIGFGKAIPGLQFRRGETNYKIGWIPLGGYVKMVGEGDNADTEEAEEDPRSFKHKSVAQRMFIISAGVIMNVLLGAICFIVAYSHGVEETPAVVGHINVGSAAWEADMRIGDRVIQIESNEKPMFDDVRPSVMSTPKDGTVYMKIRQADGTVREVNLAPRRGPEDLYPVVGIVPIDQLVLNRGRRGGPPPFQKDSPAAQATAADGSHFEGGDRIVGTSNDPANPMVVVPLPPASHDSEKPSPVAFYRNQHRMRGKPMVLRVDRDGTMLDFVVAPAFTRVIPGVRFQMGRVAAMRANGPAARATAVNASGEPGPQTVNAVGEEKSDRLIAVEVARDGKPVRYVFEAGKEKGDGVAEVVVDPLRLPYELETWAETATNKAVRVTVLRPPSETTKTSRRVAFDMTWDPELMHNGEGIVGSSNPVAISGLGLAYYIDTIVDTVDGGSAAAAAGLMKGDIVTDFRSKEVDAKGNEKWSKWIGVKRYQAGYLAWALQMVPTDEIEVRITRATPSGDVEKEFALTLANDKTWPAVERGLFFPYDAQVQKADGLGEALEMGYRRTLRTAKVIYMTLYATIFRRISAKTFSGPLSIANASYRIAGYDLWQFIVFLGLININLAIVNFLPIPVLDGGHMVFLIYEKVRGKPAPERIMDIALYIGVGLILILMAFVIYLDIRRMLF